MKNKAKMTRTRFAPSPTGSMHVGNLRTALYAYLVAKRSKGNFILRIEDTDRQRLVEDSIGKILKGLEWAGIKIDEGVVLKEGKVAETGEYGPYFQSKRLKIYEKYAKILLEKNFAYRCFCSKERLEELRNRQQRENQPPMYDKCCLGLKPDEVAEKIQKGEEHVIRLNVDPDKIVSFDDQVYGTVTVEGSTIDDQVLIKSDGYPTYHFAVVVDDHLMEISHIIRGEDWLPSTPKHVLLYEYLGWEMPKIVHVPNILAENKKKLSKRQGAVSVEDFIRQGYLPEALVNFISLLGWNPKSEKEFFTLRELEHVFELAGLNKAGAVFDYKKLDWMNAHYLKQLDDGERKGLLEPYLEEYCKKNNFELTKQLAQSIIEIEKDRIKKLADITDNIEFYFKLPTLDGSMVPWKNCSSQKTAMHLKNARDIIEGIPLEEYAIGELETKLLAAAGEQRGEMLWPLRVVLTGKRQSPSPFEVAWAIGKNETIKRIEKGIDLMLEKTA